MSQINQQEIAKQLKLSQTTVSRALSNHPAIKAQTKAAVWDLAAQKGYQVPPSKSRLSGSSNEPMIIGVLISIPKRQRGHGETSQMVCGGSRNGAHGMSSPLTSCIMNQQLTAPKIS